MTDQSLEDLADRLAGLAVEYGEDCDLLDPRVPYLVRTVCEKLGVELIDGEFEELMRKVRKRMRLGIAASSLVIGHNAS